MFNRVGTCLTISDVAIRPMSVAVALSKFHEQVDCVRNCFSCCVARGMLLQLLRKSLAIRCWNRSRRDEEAEFIVVSKHCDILVQNKGTLRIGIFLRKRDDLETNAASPQRKQDEDNEDIMIDLAMKGKGRCHVRVLFLKMPDANYSATDRRISLLFVRKSWECRLDE